MPDGFSTVFAGGHFLEGPRWHEDRIWFSDFYGLEVRSAREDGSDLRTEAEVPGQPSGPGLAAGRSAAGGVDDRSPRAPPRGRRGRWSSTRTSSGHATGHLNDMIVDEPRPGLRRQLRLRPDGRKRSRARLVAPRRPAARHGHRGRRADLMFPNGMAFPRDGVALVVAETWGNRLTAFDVADDGSLEQPPFVWAAFAPPPEQGSLAGDARGARVVASDGIGRGCRWRDLGRGRDRRPGGPRRRGRRDHRRARRRARGSSPARVGGSRRPHPVPVHGAGLPARGADRSLRGCAAGGEGRLGSHPARPAARTLGIPGLRAAPRGALDLRWPGSGGGMTRRSTRTRAPHRGRGGPAGPLRACCRAVAATRARPGSR